MSGENRFAPGQRVNVEIEGRQVAGVFVRSRRPARASTSKASPQAEGGGAIGWVRRSDTGEVEPFGYELISGD